MIARPVLDDTVDPNWGGQVTDALNFGFFANYASTALRTIGVPTPASGYYSYIDAGDQTEGPEWFNGASWTKPWNMPWGYMGGASVGASQTGITAITDLTGFSIPFTAVTGRRYKASYLLSSQQVTTAGTQVFFVDVNAVQTTLSELTGVAAAFNTVSGVFLFTVAAGARTIKLRAQTSAGTLSIDSGSAPGRLMIEDIGPSGVPT